jgi:EAL domain-containing protein (putative c-di-GMP-specific phosphodiesterase class I)
VQFGQLIHEPMQADDLAGRFTGSSFLFLLQRGNTRDVEAWAEHVVRKVAAQAFKIDDKTVSATASIGLGLVPPSATDPTPAVTDAYEACKKAIERGGNQIYSLERADNDARVQAYDKVWVRHIKAALMENRFRLVQLPIASLLGDEKAMYDVLVRMLDEHGREVLPSEFIPAAERNDLMKNIDRWVIGASMAFCAARKPDGVFVRLAKDSVNDKSLPIWLANQLKAVKIEPRRMCFQVTEDVVWRHLDQSKELRESLRKQGYGFAIERFGTGSEAQRVLEQVRPDYVKIDGSLMQGITHDMPLQARVRGLVELSKSVGAATIAERVEDANTMAVMWQLGIEFIQGYFVHKPEAVTLG